MVWHCLACAKESFDPLAVVCWSGDDQGFNVLSFGPGSGPAGQVFEECLVAVCFLQNCRGSGYGSSNSCGRGRFRVVVVSCCCCCCCCCCCGCCCGGGGGGLCLMVAALLRDIFSRMQVY